MLIAHLSDLHLRDAGDAVWLDRQLDRIAARAPAHLAITGDILDRWIPPLLTRVIDALDARGLLNPERLTILHGNHDLASSGGHPRRGADLWRLAFRFWDPPPLIRWRRRRFHEAIAARAPGISCRAPFMKTLDSGLRVATLDTVPLSWIPFTIGDRAVVLRHAIGALPHAQSIWLASPKPTGEGGALVVLMHHYPLDTPSYQWRPEPGRLSLAPAIRVPMHIDAGDLDQFWKAVESAAVRLVLCGHVHRARLEWRGGVAVGLNGQSGAAWAGRTIAWYEVTGDRVTMALEKVD